MSSNLEDQLLITEEDTTFAAISASDAIQNPQQVLFHVGMTLEEVERQMLFKTLAHFNYHKPKAAQALGISLKTVYNRLARFGYSENVAVGSLGGHSTNAA